MADEEPTTQPAADAAPAKPKGKPGRPRSRRVQVDPPQKKTIADTQTAENFKPVDLDRDEVFELYYAMGGTRSLRKLVDKVREELGEEVSLNTLSRWARTEQWLKRTIERDHKSGMNIKAALKAMAERGEEFSAVTVFGAAGTVLEATRISALSTAINSVNDLHRMAELVERLVDLGNKMMNPGAKPQGLNGANGHGNVVMGEFSARAKEVAPAAETNGKG